VNDYEPLQSTTVQNAMSIHSIGLSHDETPRVGGIATARAPPGSAGGDLRPISVTISTTRKITGLGNTTVWKLIAEKKLETVMIGRRRLVIYSSIERLLSVHPDALDGRAP
jgi:excisionase family DNA binding protein